MISFSLIDIIIILVFFAILLIVGFISSRKTTSSSEDYLLYGRRLGLPLFVMITVSTWYGGIIGVGEFTYRYGILSWVTQGFPYYFFAFLFAIFFANKIRQASLFTIPEKLAESYGKKVGLISSLIVFVLILPAPYLLMSANLISLVFHTDILLSLYIALLLSGSYLIKGGFRSNVYADAFQFFVMFLGFGLILVISFNNYGGYSYLKNNLPESHLQLTGDASPMFLLVWFLIAMWTFADPGFHQRAYAAKTGEIAKKGLLISILFFALFDFLTTSTGLYAKALIPDLDQPVNAFPLLAEIVLSPGFKGVFYAALFATIISTLNSFLFLSATTISRDFIYNVINHQESKTKFYTIIGIITSGIISIIISYLIPSVIEIWYTIGTLFIPAIILPVIAAYYPKLKLSEKIVLYQMIGTLLITSIWFFAREYWKGSFIYDIEPMIVGLTFSIVIQSFGLFLKSSFFNQRK